jgi:hypothetical protein
MLAAALDRHGVVFVITSWGWRGSAQLRSARRAAERALTVGVEVLDRH